MTERPYNPLDYANLTINLVRELMSREPVAIPLPKKFPGPGVYALFYQGDFKPYAAIRSPDSKTPIYVGKAVPPGARKGGGAEDENAAALYGRIRQHASSIKAVENLRLADFRCRYLTVVPLWITMAERFLIEHYRPVWNRCIDGFGIHNPGKGRHEGEIPRWDTLHPGRPWAANLRQTRTIDSIQDQLRAFFQAEGPNREVP